VSTSTREANGSYKNKVERVNGSETVATAGFVAITSDFDLHDTETGMIDDDKVIGMWRSQIERYRTMLDKAPGIDGATIAALHGATLESCAASKIVLERRDLLVEYLRPQTSHKRRATLRAAHPDTCRHGRIFVLFRGCASFDWGLVCLQAHRKSRGVPQAHGMCGAL
jgi:hypothetical protein